MTVNILGAEYTVVVKKYDEDEVFERENASGYCSYTDHEIVLCNMATFPDWENETDRACDRQMKMTLRHEIIHAFLGESGLSANSNGSDAWAHNEEMVDWFAIQGPKIWKAWQEAGAIETYKLGLDVKFS